MKLGIIVTLAGVAVIVAALALFIIAIGLSLRRLSRSLNTVLGALEAIRDASAPAGPVLDGIVGDVTAIEHDLDEVLSEVAALTGPPVSPQITMEEAVTTARQASPRERTRTSRAAPITMEEAVAAARQTADGTSGNQVVRT